MQSYVDDEATTVTEEPVPIPLMPNPVSNEDEAQTEAFLANARREIIRSGYYRLMWIIAIFGIATGIIVAIVLR